MDDIHKIDVGWFHSFTLPTSYGEDGLLAVYLIS
jgi:hypothetical protein